MSKKNLRDCSRNDRIQPMANRAKIKEVDFSVGDIVRVTQSFKEKDKEKVQVFEGKVISIKGRALGKTFTVRRLGADKIGVEKIFPLSSPTITNLEVKKSSPAKRAKLYYLRDKVK